MIDSIISLLPRIQKYGNVLDTIEVFVDKKWILIDDNENMDEYEFARYGRAGHDSVIDGKLTMSIKGQTIIGSWEFRPSQNELLIAKKPANILLQQLFISDGLLILKRRYGTDENPFILYNKLVIPDGDIKTYIKQFQDLNFTIVDKCVITIDKKIDLLVAFLREQLLKLKCSCSLKGKESEYWSDLKNYLLGYDEDLNSYEINFSKGFLFWVTNEFDKAYYYLTNAINANPLCDILYNLRAEIDSSINKDNINDAYKAVALNPSARNYFTLGSTLEKSNPITEEMLAYYKKSIEMDCKFAHAYTKISNYYNGIRKYEDALFYIEDAIKNNPEKYFLKQHLGLLYWQMNKYCSALTAYSDYIHGTTEIEDLEEAKGVKNSMQKEIWELGISQIKLKNYEYAASLINCYLRYGGHEHFITLVNNVFEKKMKFSENEIDSLKQKIDGWVYTHNKDLKIDIRKIKAPQKRHRGGIRIGNTIFTTSDYDLNEIFQFGKYKNESIFDTAIKDPSYLLWCVLNLNHFSISELLVVILLINNKIDNGKSFEAIELNLIKLNLVGICEEYYNDSSELDYDPWDELRSHGENPWEDVFGPGDGADTAYWNTD